MMIEPLVVFSIRKFDRTSLFPGQEMLNSVIVEALQKKYYL